MTFNSLTFVIFFAVILGIHRLPLPWTAKKFNLLIASYVFYAAWNPPFVLVLMFSTVLDWFVARRMGGAKTRERRRLLLVCSVGANLGLLGYFKYGGFLVTNFSLALGALGMSFQPARPDIVLPVGISFYTFQTLSYTIDVYRGRIQPCSSLLDYALYVTFFPQLVSGPIVRAETFLPQLERETRADAAGMGWGLSLLVIGLFNKTVVADGILADLADQLFHGATEPGFISAWCGTAAFAGQIFCDFAGYTACAIGAAMCLGFMLPDNFRFPYAAIGFSDFWRRWHISLSAWLRDYLYFSIGGNRRGDMRTYQNLMATMLLGGLWHGASWTFVAWGGLHGCYLVLERVFRRYAPDSAIWNTKAVRALLGLLTFALVCIAWVFFRAESFSEAFTIGRAMLGFGSASPTFAFSRRDIAICVLTVGAILAVHWRLRDTTLDLVAARMSWPAKAFILAAMLVLICTTQGNDRAFIYFQF